MNAAFQAMGARAKTSCVGGLVAFLAEAYVASVDNLVNDSIEEVHGNEGDPSLPAGMIQTTGEGVTSELNGLADDLQDLRDDLLALQTALGGALTALDTNFVPPASKVLQVPDPRLDYGNAKSLKTAAGLPEPGASNADKVRSYLAENFERMARIFVAGTAQLSRDMGNYSGPQIRGLYEGFEPDLLNTQADGSILQGAYNREWGSCGNGVVSSLNASMNWFKFPDGSYGDEKISSGKVFSHRCAGTPLATPDRPEPAAFRGKLVDVYMLLMRKMIADLRAGKIISAGAYNGIPDLCAQKMAAIQASRDHLIEIMDRIGGGTRDAAGTRRFDVRDCGGMDVSEEEQTSALKNDKTLASHQVRMCVAASMQTQLELKLALNYAYCTWRVISIEMRDRIVQQTLRTSVDIERFMDVLELQAGIRRAQGPAPAAPLVPAGASWLSALAVAATFLRRRRRSFQSAAIAALVVVGAGPACRRDPPETTGTCGSGYDDGGQIRIEAFSAGAPTSPSQGLPALNLGNGNRWTIDGSNPGGGSWIPVCQSRCEGLRLKILAYQARTNQLIADPAVSDDLKTQAQARLADYNPMYANAMNACRGQIFKAYKTPSFSAFVSSSRRARVRQQVRDASLQKANEACTCVEPSNIGFVEYTVEQPELPTDGDNKKQGDLDDNGRNSAGGLPGDDPAGPPPAGQGVVTSAVLAGSVNGLRTAGAGNTNLNVSGASGQEDLRRKTLEEAELQLGGTGAKADGAYRGRGGGYGVSNGGTVGFDGSPDAKAAGPTLSGDTATDDRNPSGVAGSVYTSGGATSGRNPGSAYAMYGGYGNGAGGSGGPSSEMSFGSAEGGRRDPASSREVNPMGSEDPADYFTRIGISENLFKKVERVYVRKAGAWGLEDMRSRAGKNRFRK